MYLLGVLLVQKNRLFVRKYLLESEDEAREFTRQLAEANSNCLVLPASAWTHDPDTDRTEVHQDHALVAAWVTAWGPR